jgi:hypothetical protein
MTIYFILRLLCALKWFLLFEERRGVSLVLVIPPPLWSDCWFLLTHSLQITSRKINMVTIYIKAPIDLHYTEFLIYDWPRLRYLGNRIVCCSVDHCWFLNMEWLIMTMLTWKRDWQGIEHQTTVSSLRPGSLIQDNLKLRILASSQRTVIFMMIQPTQFY